MDAINKIVSQKYNRHQIVATDPAPILIRAPTEFNGPFPVQGGMVICDKCTNIIRQSYLSLHRSSGACQRLVERNTEKQSHSPNENTSDKLAETQERT